MKSLLYAAATLMIGASIFGFVDYSETSRQKEFETMFTEKEKADPAMIAEQIPQASEAISTEKKQELVITKSGENESKTRKLNVLKRGDKTIRKKQSLNYKSFSRAPLRNKIMVATDLEEVKLKEQ